MAIRRNRAENELAFEAVLNGAKRFCMAADLLLSTPQAASVNDPIYVLYFHATELALKAFLRSGGEKTAALKNVWKHNLEKLYAEALARGLAPDTATALDLTNVVYLLHAGNKGEAFRYFTLESRVMPDVAWAGAIVRALIALVERQTGYEVTEPGPAVKLDLVFGEPVKRSSGTK